MLSDASGNGPHKAKSIDCIDRLAAIILTLTCRSECERFYVEKVRSQFLSLRQLAQGRVFSGRSRWQLGPIATPVSNLGSGLPTGRTAPLFSEKPVSLRTSGLHRNGTVREIRLFPAIYEAQ